MYHRLFTIVTILLLLTVGCANGKQACITIHTDIGGLSQYMNLPEGTVEVHWFRFAQPLSKNPSTGSWYAVGPTEWGIMAVVAVEPEKFEAYIKSCKTSSPPKDGFAVAKCYMSDVFRNLLGGTVLQYEQASDKYVIRSDEVYIPTPTLKLPMPDGIMIPLRDKNTVLIIVYGN